MRTLAAVLAIVAVPGALGCGALVCTQIVCSNGFALVLAGNLPTEYTVLMDTDGRPRAQFTFSCSPSFCPLAFVTEGTVAAVLDVAVRDLQGAELAQQSFEPNYEPSYPNGTRCGPACLHATDTWSSTDNNRIEILILVVEASS